MKGYKRHVSGAKRTHYSRRCRLHCPCLPSRFTDDVSTRASEGQQVPDTLMLPLMNFQLAKCLDLCDCFYLM